MSGESTGGTSASGGAGGKQSGSPNGGNNIAGDTEAPGGEAGAPAQAGAGAGGNSSGAGAGGMPSGEAGAGNEAGDGGTEPPQVVAVAPADGASGVLASASFDVTFSAAMNLESVESAVTVSTLSASDLVFTWSSAGRKLSIAPKLGWSYATGTDPALAALKYTVAIATSAKDAQGRSLASSFSASFATRRRITQTLPSATAGDYSDYGHAVGDVPTLCKAATDTLHLTSWSSVASSGTFFGFVTFDTTLLGAPGADNTLEAASFVATQAAPEGAFYPTHQVNAAKLAYQAINSTVLSASVVANLGTFCTSAQTLKPSANVLTSLKADFDAGKKGHLFRLAPTPIDKDGTSAHFACGGFSLVVTRLAR